MEAQVSSSLGCMGPLPEKLRSLLVSPEYQLPKQQEDGNELLEHLQTIKRLLINLSKVEAPNMMVKHWMNQVRDLSYDIEDYIDRKQLHSNTNEEALSKVEAFSSLVKRASYARKRHERYALGRWASNSSFMVDGRDQIPNVKNQYTDLIGINGYRAELIDRLNNYAQQQLKVVPILGPRGVGKTALAKQVYRQIGGQFECRAFVRASMMPDTRRLLRSIIAQVKVRRRPPYGYTVQDLIDNLREHLHDKRYFIVIDGLWKTTSWDIVNSAFPQGAHCSRILITTDIDEVALDCCDHQSHGIIKMKPLNRHDSKELFFTRVFDSKHECPEQLKEVSEEVITECCGIPLVIISIASILASQPDNLELWKHVKENLLLSMKNNPTSENILREVVCLNYNNLSHHLKTCLLYLTMYPEGYTFFKADLVRQWTAEGFISTVAGNGTNEAAETLTENEHAESYFDELVGRGFIQPNHVNYSDEVMFYTVHSTVYEVIKPKSREENFTTEIDYSDTIMELSAKVRRLSLSFSNAKYATKPEGITLSPVRSLIFYGFVECLPSINEFEVLRVLILELWGDQGELDLSGIDRLFQLRHMQLTTDILVKLPTNMSGLQHLETLELYARVTTVPSDIVELPKLLHLHIQGEIKLPDFDGKMRSLRTLQSFDLSCNSEDNVRSLGKMTSLHDLHLTCSIERSDYLKRNLIALVSSLGQHDEQKSSIKHDKLKSFILAPAASCTNIYLDCSSSISSLPVSLQKLELLPPICLFSRLPKWIGQLQKLCILKIVVRELTRDDVGSIAGLQELTVLSLYVRQPTAEGIIFNSKAFSVLKYFKFRCGVLSLAFQAEAMPNLRRLKLEFNAHGGEQNSTMLSGIQHLLNLQDIAGRIGAAPGAEELDRMAAEFVLKVAISKHSRPLSVNIRWVKWVDEEISQFSDQPLGSSHIEDLAVEPLAEFKAYGDEPQLSVPVVSKGTSSQGLLGTKEQKSSKMCKDPPPEISHRAYPEHKLMLMTAASALFLCDGCKEPGDGPRYTCERGCGRSFDLHMCCALEEEDTILVHPLFGDSVFVFRFVPPPPDNRRACDACGEASRGFIYHCSEKDLDLHPCCASLPELIHQDGRVFELRREASHPCVLCGETGRCRRSWAYRSYFDGEAVGLHVVCMKEMARLRWEATYRNRVGGGQMVQASALKIMDRVFQNMLPHSKKRRSSGFDQILKIAGTVASVIIGAVSGCGRVEYMDKDLRDPVATV